MAIRFGVIVEQVVHTHADLKLLALEETSSDKKVAEVEEIVISSLCTFEILEYKGSCECIPLKEHPLDFCRGMVHDKVVGHLAEFTAIVIQCISCKILDSEVNLFADVAV